MKKSIFLQENQGQTMHITTQTTTFIYFCIAMIIYFISFIYFYLKKILFCRLIGGSDYKLIYRHYATLYFVFCVDSSESELGILDLIQVR